MRENKKIKLHKALHIGAGAAILLIALCLLFSCSNSPAEYTVTFNLNGGSLDGETSPTEKALEGALVSNPGEPKRDGYIFLGWYSDAEGNSEYIFETPITSSITIYAKWAKESVTVTYSYYDLKAAETKGFKGGERVSSEDLSAPSGFTGGTFVGWYYEDETAFSSEDQLIDDITLYPRWQDYAVYSSTYLVFSESGLRVWAEAAKTEPSLSCILLSDITLTSSNESENTWSPIGSQGAQYTGTFDGKGHTITGVKIHSNDTSYLGFFGYIGSGGDVKNLNLENVDIQYDNNSYVCSSGSIAGYLEGSIANCIVSGVIFISNSHQLGSLDTGGIAGYIDGGSISKCINRCEISSTSSTNPRTGGIAGSVSSGTISDSQNYGSINFDGYGGVSGGGISGSINNSKVISCYNSGNIVGKNNRNISSAMNESLYLGGIAGRSIDSSIKDCKIENCTIEATYYSDMLGDDIYIGKFVGNIVADSSNSGEAIINKIDLSTSTT